MRTELTFWLLSDTLQRSGSRSRVTAFDLVLSGNQIRRDSTATHRRAHELYARADAAAAARDLEGMVKAVFATKVLDLMAEKLMDRHRVLPRSDVEWAIAEAMTTVVEKVTSGENVERPIEFIWRVARLRAIDRARHALKLGWGVSLEALAEDRRLDGELYKAPGESPSEDLEGAIKAALRIAKQELLPLFGMGHRRSVLATDLETLEKSGEILRNSEMAKRVGISVGNVRTIRSRNWDQLEILAREAGYHEVAEGLAAMIQDVLEEDAEEDEESE